MTINLMGGASKINSTVAHISGGLVGVVSLVNTATAKFGPMDFTSKAVYTASQIIGPDLTWAAIGGANKASVTVNGVAFSKGQLPSQSVNPWGALNSTTYSGIALLILDYALKETVGSKYGLNYAHPWLQAIGAGLTFGGVFGGVFDPVARSGSTGSITSFASGRRGGPTGYAPSGGYLGA